MENAGAVARSRGAVPCRDMPAVRPQNAEEPDNPREHTPEEAQLKRTYSKFNGCRLTPRIGGAIQFANLPGSITRPVISDCTNF
jgi:hypothetical protein